MHEGYWQTRYRTSVERAAIARSFATREAHLALASHYRQMDRSLGSAQSPQGAELTFPGLC
jgi:hypothetical protein